MHERPAIDHWRRFRRLMALMSGLAVVAVGGALWALHRDGVVLHWQFMLALGLGIGVSLLLAGALMGLVFVSAASGHDDAVIDPTDDVRNTRGRKMKERNAKGRPVAGPPSPWS